MRTKLTLTNPSDDELDAAFVEEVVFTVRVSHAARRWL